MSRLVLAMCAVALFGCDSASSDLGRDAQLQITGAQWRPGPAPDDDGGPMVVAAMTQRSSIVRDGDRQRLTGVLGASATGVWLGLDGDDGGWIVSAGLPSVDTPQSPSLAAELALAATTPLGPATVRVIAIESGSRAGPAIVTTLMVDDSPLPTGELVIALSWDGLADLDLHVVAADGGEAWSGDPNTWEPPPPGTPIDPNAWRAGGLLDHDGNGGCRRDPRPREDVIWTMPPPAGHYVVRVDARSLCGGPIAYFGVAAYRNDTVLASGRGSATAADAIVAHGAGAGRTVLEFDVL